MGGRGDLDRPRQVGDILDPVVVTVEAGDLLVEHAGQDGQALGQPLAPLGRRPPRDAQLVVLGPDGAAADAHLDPAA